MASPEVAMAGEVFDQFCNATTLKSILGHFRHLCDLLKIKPTNFHQFYPKLKSKLRSWKAQALWKKFDLRANHKCYNRGKACLNTRVLIIGGGPCGMRSAIEAQLLGAKVVVVEKRDRMSRNNVLHLWPFVIQDLRGLGAKKFFGKFCAGSIDHISIRQLQCILLKVALILGVEFHESVSFDQLIPPPEDQEGGKIGWRAKTLPTDHPVSQYEFDVLIGADGKRNTLEGFKRKEFRGKLAIAITANFINKRTEAEARVEEISGVAFIFNQKFFKELYSDTGIDLENIVYYKDDTHYFVMTAKKHSLIDKGVILQDHPDTAKLLAKENVDREALMLYAREAAEFSTEYQMMDMEFAVNHYGQPDVAMFDFTSMYAAENASRVLERHGHRLLMILVGDSLLEPFWPTGSGCARGFLSSMDACWAIKGWGSSLTPLEVIAERESIYRLLGQTTPENLNRDYAAYTLDPHTRYPNLNVRSVTSIQVRSLLDTDDPETFKLSPVQAAIDMPKKRRRRDSQVHPDTLLHWLQRQVALYDGVRIQDMGVSFKSGLAIAAIIHRYRPDLIDYHSLKKDDPTTNNQIAFDILEKELGIPPIMTGEEMVQCDAPDKLTMFSYLTQIYEAFRGEIPHIKHPKLEPEIEDRPTLSQKLSELTAEQKAQLLGRITKQDGSTTRVRRSRHVNENLPLPGDKKSDSITRRHARKRRSTEKMGASVEERTQRLQDIEKNRLERMLRRQYQRKRATQQFYKSMQMLQANAKREKSEPFEDYSIFLYRQTAPDFKDRVKDLEQKIIYPDREPKLHAGYYRGSMDEGFSGRIKNIEEKLKGTASAEKKPKDLLRAIGKIEKTDWNVKEIEKKIEENKMGRSIRHDRVERVPKWSREQFLARQTKMEKRGREPMEMDSKYADIDNTLKNLDRKIKEGNVLGHNKVSAMAEQFSNKNQDASAVDQPKVQRSNSKVALALPAQGGSEVCHFCEKRVYLMERLTAEGKSFHRGCFRCEYCSTSLRIGNHTFDRDKNGGRFYCTQHFGLPGTMKNRIEKKKVAVTNKENIPQSSNSLKAPDKAKISLDGISGLDLLDRGQTPERIEFENLAGISDTEEAHSIMDEDEWTDRNFGPSAAEMGSSDDISDMSDSDEDNEVFEEAIDQPLTTEGTLELAKNWTLRYSHPHPAAAHSDTGSNEYEDSSDEYTSTEEDSQTATEDEDDVRARELRKKEVWLQVPLRNSDTETGSETEVKQSQTSSNNNDENNLNNQKVPSLVNIAVANGVGSASVDLAGETASRAERLIARMNVKKKNQISTHLIQGDNTSLGSLGTLPDAIPSCISESGNQKNLEVAGVLSSSYNSGNNNLPDLITSSPKLSRNSSRLSLLSDDASYTSSDDALIKDEDMSEKLLTVRLITPESSCHEVDSGLNQSEISKNKVVVIVTAPTPTNEKPFDNSLIESSKLVVPKENCPIKHQESQPETPTSFDNLIHELRQRKARNKAEAEAKKSLKPLTTETAKLHMSKYFDTKKEKKKFEDKKKVLKRQDSTLKNIQNDSKVNVVNLKVKSKLSDKVDKKDILKYFSGSSFKIKSSPENKLVQKSNLQITDKNDDEKNDDEECIYLDELACDGFEVEEIEREFNEIERQNKSNLDILQSVEINKPSTKIYTDLFDDFGITHSDTAVSNNSQFSNEEIVNYYKINNNDTLNKTLPITRGSEISRNNVDSNNYKINNDNSVLEMINSTEDSKILTNNIHTVKNSPINNNKIINNYQADSLHAINIPSTNLMEKTNSSIRKSNSMCDIINNKPVEQIHRTVIVSNNVKDKPLISSNDQSNNNCRKVINNQPMRISGTIIFPNTLGDKQSKGNNSFETIDSNIKVHKLSSIKPKENPKLFWLNLIKTNPQNAPIQKVMIKEQQIVPLRATQMKTEDLSSNIKNQMDTISLSSDDTPKKPGRRRIPKENISFSQPSTPILSLRGDKSDLRKSLSIKLGKHSDSESLVKSNSEIVSKSTLSSPLPRKKNGLLSQKSDMHGSLKSVDLSKINKEKCIIS